MSSWLSGIDVSGAQDGFSCCVTLSLLYLVAKLFHMGVMWKG
jgi:hypothetical protein